MNIENKIELGKWNLLIELLNLWKLEEFNNGGRDISFCFFLYKEDYDAWNRIRVEGKVDDIPFYLEYFWNNELEDWQVERYVRDIKRLINGILFGHTLLTIKLNQYPKLWHQKYEREDR